MKGHKRKHKEGGGPTGGADEAEQDLKDKPAQRTVPGNVTKEAEEMKRGGKTKRHRARGGKTVGVISGPEPPAHMGRKPRKSGGRTSESNPFTKANKGTDPKGHKTGGPAPLLEGENEPA
jgi:hypothetical protein